MAGNDAEFRVRIERDGDGWAIHGVGIRCGESPAKWHTVFKGKAHGAAPADADQVQLMWSALCSVQTALSAWAKVSGRKL